MISIAELTIKTSSDTTYMSEHCVWQQAEPFNQSLVTSNSMTVFYNNNNPRMLWQEEKKKMSFVITGEEITTELCFGCYSQLTAGQKWKVTCPCHRPMTVETDNLLTLHRGGHWWRIHNIYYHSVLLVHIQTKASAFTWPDMHLTTCTQALVQCVEYIQKWYITWFLKGFF